MKRSDWHKLTRMLSPNRGPITEKEAAVILKHMEIKTPPHLTALILRRTANFIIRAYVRAAKTGSPIPNEDKECPK